MNPWHYLEQSTMPWGQYLGYLVYRYPAISLFGGLVAGYILSSSVGWQWWSMLLGGFGILLLILSLCLGSGFWGWRRPLLLRLALLLAVSALSATYASLRTPLPAHSLQPQWANHLQQASIHSLASSGVSPEVQTLVEAVALGHTPSDSGGRRLRAIFVDGGIAHLLAVSGFHLGVIYMILRALGRLTRLGRRGLWIEDALILVGCGVYTLVTGASIPTLRALVMLGLYLWGRWLGRRSYPLNILMTTAVLQYIYDPHSLESYSFVLSYTAMLGIFLFFPVLEQALGEFRYRGLSWVWVSILLTISVQAFLLPLGLYLFGRVSWAYLWTSLPSMLLTTILIPLSFLLFFLSVLGLPIGWLGSLIQGVGEALLRITDSLGSIPQLTWYVDLKLWQLVLWYLPILVGALWIQKRLPEED